MIRAKKNLVIDTRFNELMKHYKLGFPVIVLLFTQLLTSQSRFPTATPEAVGMSSEGLSLLTAEMHQFVLDGKLAGIQTAIVRKGKLVHFDTFGFANIEDSIPLKENSLFRIFSMTKPIVSVALMQLHEAGKFKLEDPVELYIPEFKEMKVYHEERGLGTAKNPIRVIDLLRHTSGLGYGRSGNAHIDGLYRSAGLMSSNNLKEFVTKLSTIPLYFEPGTDWEYSQATVVCGYLVEVLSGKPLDKYLKEHLLDPLGMNDTFFEIPEEKVSRFTVGYGVRNDGKLYVSESAFDNRYTREVTLINGGGGLVSTTADYMLFCQMLLNCGTLGDARILKMETVDLMTRDHMAPVRERNPDLHLSRGETGFGLGFAIASDRPGENRGVYGWGGAVGTYFRIDPSKELAYVLMIQLSPYRQLQLRSRFQALVNAGVVDP